MRKAGFDISDLTTFRFSGKSRKRKSIRDELRRESPHGIGVYLWSHKIAHYNTKKNRLSISSAGWQTNTTKERLNKLLEPTGNRIIQKNYSWYLENVRNRRVPFKNFMSFKLRR